MKLLGIGDNVCDVYIHKSTMYPGGQSMNVAVYAKMLGFESAYIGVFGTDEVAEHVIDTLKKLNIPTSHCRQVEGENGCARVTLVDGDRFFLGSNKGGVARTNPIRLSSEDLDYVKSFSVLHTSNNSFIDEELPKLAETGVPISYDFSRDWLEDEDWVRRIAPFCTFGFCSLPDEISDEDVKKYCSQLKTAGCNMVIATRGSVGAYYYDGDRFLFCPSNYVKAIDTLGAGDSYTAAFLVNYHDLLEKSGLTENNKFEDPSAYEELVKKAMAEAAVFSAKTCLINGAFDMGKVIDPEKYLRGYEGALK